MEMGLLNGKINEIENKFKKKSKSNHPILKITEMLLPGC